MKLYFSRKRKFNISFITFHESDSGKKVGKFSDPISLIIVVEIKREYKKCLFYKKANLIRFLGKKNVLSIVIGKKCAARVIPD